MALTVQPRAKLVNAITSFPSVAKGTGEEKKKRKKRGVKAHWGESLTQADDM